VIKQAVFIPVILLMEKKISPGCVLTGQTEIFIPTTLSKTFQITSANCMALNFLTPTTLRWSTLSATSRKEGKKTPKPSFPLAEERVVERSKDRVS